MSARFIGLLGLFFVATLVSASGAPASSITLTADADVLKPQIVAGMGNLVTRDRTVNNLADGYAVVDLSDTVTANAIVGFQVDRITQRAFTLSDGSLVGFVSLARTHRHAGPAGPMR